MKNRRKVVATLLLTTIFLPLVMNKAQPSCGTALEDLDQQAPTIQAVATAYAEGEDWAIQAVETWDAAGRPSEGGSPP